MSTWSLEERQRRQLKALLINLEGVSYEIAVGTLIFKKGGAAGIYYSKINGNVALRPRCSATPAPSSSECKALHLARMERREDPIADDEIEPVTYLERVTKKGDQEMPPMRDSQAVKRLREIGADRGRRKAITMHKEGRQL